MHAALKRCSSLAMFTALIATVFIDTVAAADQERPTTPPNAFAVIYSSSAGEVFWERATDNHSVVFYRVYRGSELVFEQDATSFYDTDLTSGASYSYQISAVDAAGNESPRTAIVSFIVPGSPSPPTTEGLANTVGNDNSTETAMPHETPQQLSGPGTPQSLTGVIEGQQYTLSWLSSESPSGQVGYNVYQNGVYIATTFDPQFSSMVSTMGKHVFVIVAFDSSQNFSAKSSSITLISDTAPQSLAPATDPVIAALAPQQSSLPNPGNVDEPASSTDSTDDPASDTALGLLPPATVTAISTIAGSLTLSWEASDHADVTGYNVYRDGRYRSTVAAPLYQDAGLVAGQVYSYQLSAFTRSETYSELSTEMNFYLDESTGSVVNIEPLPEPIDPYNSHLELHHPPVRSDGLPATPRYLRVNLLSNNWVELDWTPSVDDGGIVEYRVYRDDGVMYSITDLSIDNAGAQREASKFWASTSFIDCNYTRFSDRVHNCSENQPLPGARHEYYVTAVDNDGNESARSNSLEVNFYETQGDEVLEYKDIYLNENDRFPFESDFSNTDHFLDTFQMVFEDEFNQSTLDLANWHTSLTWTQEEVINGELQYFVDTERNADFGFNPFVMSGNSLLISAIPTPPDLAEKANGHPFLSGALSSHDKFGFTYGYVEARMKVGDIPGMLSSFYLFRRWAAEHAPEIDIVEYLANNPYGDEEAFETYHYRDPVNDIIRSSPTMSVPPEPDTRFGDDFHTYGVLWEPGLVIWYIDGQEVQRLSGTQIARQQMNIVLYLVTGSEWTPAPDPALDQYPLQFEIDYVRVYQRIPYIR